MKDKLKALLKGQEGINTVEVVIILAIVVGLAIIFRNQLLGYANALMDGIFQNTGSNFDPNQMGTTP